MRFPRLDKRFCYEHRTGYTRPSKFYIPGGKHIYTDFSFSSRFPLIVPVGNLKCVVHSVISCQVLHLPTSRLPVMVVCHSRNCISAEVGCQSRPKTSAPKSRYKLHGSLFNFKMINTNGLFRLIE